MSHPNRVFVVVGGASGLGAAVATRLSDRATTFVVDLPSSAPVETAKELATRFVPADVTNSDQVAAAFAEAARCGPVRAVITCAGIATPGRIYGSRGALPLDEFRRVIDVNLVGTFNVISRAAEVMAGNETIDDERGVIVCTSSIAAFDGQIGQAAYAASKGGVASLTLAGARDLAERGIRVVSIAPGLFDTPLLAGLPEAARTALGAAVPFPSRLGRPDEFARAVEHVLDNQMLNGEVLRLDGALRMAPR